MGVLLGMALLWLVLSLAANALERRIEAELAELQQEQKRSPLGIEVEQIDNMIYGWDHETKDFLCQGTNLRELQQHFKCRFPNRAGYIADGPKKLISELKRQIKQAKNEDSDSIRSAS
jgi:hypothetical protein